jgi:hypothetical protein
MSPGSRFRLARFRLEWKLLERRSPGRGRRSVTSVNASRKKDLP